MVFFRQAIFLHFAYMRRLWVRGLCGCFRALSRKENIHIAQNEVVKTTISPFKITQFIIENTRAQVGDL